MEALLKPRSVVDYTACSSVSAPRSCVKKMRDCARYSGRVSGELCKKRLYVMLYESIASIHVIIRRGVRKNFGPIFLGTGDYPWPCGIFRYLVLVFFVFEREL